IVASGSTLNLASDLVPAKAPAPSAADNTTTAEVEAGATALAKESAGQAQPSLDVVERDYILAILGQTNWMINGPRGAAKVLGLNPNTLRNRMKKLGITRS